MAAQTARSAVCMVVLERQGERVLIVVKLIHDSRTRSVASRLLFVDPDEAVDAVRDFVEIFARGTPP